MHDQSDETDSEDGKSAAGRLPLRRRTVLGAVAAAGAVGALSEPAAADAADDASAKPASVEGDDAPPGTDALLAYVEANYGEELTDDRLDAVRAGIEADLRAAAEVRAVDLDPATEPAFAFRPHRGED
ncbi:hypothetical protein [Halegenticoccus tardaugens]|uniref:hypothetical protein n=1 Tax=Halegenticoccus tardaugens TaxID=2071624 RepID=UPI00100C0725|nr:hypothetical protein [Halegenticoccus tardaugens]